MPHGWVTAGLRKFRSGDEHLIPGLDDGQQRELKAHDSADRNAHVLSLNVSLTTRPNPLRDGPSQIRNAGFGVYPGSHRIAAPMAASMM
jgi:hypothetical protein